MTTIGNLDTYFTNIIADIMLWESMPLKRLQQQKQQVNARSVAYTEADNKLNELQSAVQSLMSGDAFNALKAGRSSSISNVASGYTVLSATVSNSALAGVYNIEVTRLAQEQRVRSNQQVYADQGLGLAGTILLGGDASRSVASEVYSADTVTDFSTGSIASGQKELGRGNYYVETRNDATNGWQFRMVDFEGKAVSVRQGTSDDYSSDWQSIPTGGGEYDTGRGLTFTFAASGYQATSRATSTAANVNYKAQGASISIAATDSLINIASKINSATFAENNNISATVVDRQLVLAAGHSGASYTMRAQDSVGSVLQSLGVISAADTFVNSLQTAQDALFKVNGLNVTRSANSNITDVISGVSLSLAPDAVAADGSGRSGTLTVSQSWTAARSAIDSFITTFNNSLTYLEQKTALTQASTGPTPTYSRGPLADDNIFSGLRGDLFNLFMSDAANSGALDNLREIGLTIDDNLRATVSDSSKLEDALNNNFDAVVDLVDAVMGKFDTLLSRFTGDGLDTGYLDSAVDGLSDQLSLLDSDITDLNTRLADREQYLVDQYAEMQGLLISLSYSQQMWSSIYGTTSRLY